jgi:ubiquinone/menaquinone biosynthesis C-methylase UbiE
MFSMDASLCAGSADRLPALKLGRVLDVGCGAGQELLPFVADGHVTGIGIDISDEVGIAGRELMARDHPKARIFYARAAAEHLPFESESFDVVLCRVALPYMDNKQALGEMARVTRSGGAVVLKIHHWSYYRQKFVRGLLDGEFRSSIHAVRVLIVGFIYHLTRHQPRNRLIGAETFQTRGLLQRELARFGTKLTGELKDSNALTPAFIAIKE